MADGTVIDSIKITVAGLMVMIAVSILVIQFVAFRDKAPPKHLRHAVLTGTIGIIVLAAGYLMIDLRYVSDEWVAFGVKFVGATLLLAGFWWFAKIIRASQT